MKTKLQTVLNVLAKAARVIDLIVTCANGVVSVVDTNDKASS